MSKSYIIIITLLFLYSCKQHEYKKNVINNLSLPSDTTSEKQSDLIFSTSKIFPNKTQFSIALIKNGKVHFIGVKRSNDTISNIENHQSVFEIGSLTKLFTATILANFVLDGKLKLEDNIKHFINSPIKDNLEISFKQLANHTSGLPKMPSNLIYSDKLNKFKEYDSQKLETYLQGGLKLSFTPGEKNSYSNIGFGILGYLLCKISTNNYSQLLDTYILSKYNMKRTSINRKVVNDNLIKGLNINGIETPNWDLASLSPAGGILSSVEDLSKFAIAQFNPLHKDLVLTQQKTFQIKKYTSQGLGWRIEKNAVGEWFCHNGRTGGYTSSILLDLKNKNGIIVLSNISTIGNKNKKYIVNLGTELLKTL